MLCSLVGYSESLLFAVRVRSSVMEGPLFFRYGSKAVIVADPQVKAVHDLLPNQASWETPLKDGALRPEPVEAQNETLVELRQPPG